jgi:hypothetical protein
VSMGTWPSRSGAPSRQIGRDQRLVLGISESNLRAARSYRSYGFVETGERRAMDRDPTIIEIELAYPLGD